MSLNVRKRNIREQNAREQHVREQNVREQNVREQNAREQNAREQNVRKQVYGKIVALGAALFLAGGSAGCGGTEENAGGGLTGSIRMVGSTSMEKLANVLAESFMDRYPDVEVTIEFSGSGAGVGAVITGASDIGNSSRKLRDEEKEQGAVENVVAIEGIAVCVDTANTVTNLTGQQLLAIYTGKVKNWKELGGMDSPVVVVGRETGSGTRVAFEELLGAQDICTYANELDSTGAVMAKVASTPGAIGYVSLDVMDDSVKAISLEGVMATAENIKAGRYFLSRPFVMATRGAIDRQSELVREWFRYVYSREGQQMVAQAGLIPVR